MEHMTVEDAKVYIDNSGWLEAFEFETLEDVYEWTWRNNATAEEAAKHFNVAYAARD